jgi:hypothetical protein
MDPFKYLIDAGKADPGLLRKTYLSLAKKLHPDLTELDPAEATRRMQELNESYENALRLAGQSPAPAEKVPDKDAAKTDEAAEKKVRTLVLHIGSVVDDYLRNVSRVTGLSTTVKESLERISANCSYLEAERPETALNGLASAFRAYASDPAHLAWLSDPKSRKLKEGIANLRREANLFLSDLFLENRRLFVRSELRELAVFFAGRMKSLSERAKTLPEEQGSTVLGLCEALRLSLTLVLPSLKEHHRKSLIV